MRHWLVISLPLTLPVVLPSLASAQEIQFRLQDQLDPKPQKSKYFRLAQIEKPAGPKGVQDPAPAPVADPDNPAQTAPVPVLKGRKPISFGVDMRIGVDKAKVFVPGLTPFQATVRRRIRTMVLSGGYPLSQRTRVSVNVPLISQYTQVRGNGGSFSQRGSGIGDISIWVDHSIPRSDGKLEFGVAGGLILPTGRDPFGLPDNKLPTGLGFYQPAVRLSARTLSVPIQFYGSVDYSSSLSATHDGQRRRLPASYGAETGFFYSLGPEWTTQTSVSLGKSSSPVLQSSGTTVGYLTQALNYRAGGRTSFRGALDVGLTDDSTDAYFGLSLNTVF